MKFDNSDPRLKLAIAIAEVECANDISISDFDKVEDNFINKANAMLIDVDNTINLMKQNGLSELADLLTVLNEASQAYDWARENL